MPEPDQATRVIRFGVFEVDLHTTELRKQGVRIRLPLQSFQVLEALLRQPGELVTRKELKEKLWPAESFGDFEHGLNAAVNRVREALGDSSDNPRFVETLPRRGYRFLAPVNGAPQSTAASVLEDGEAGKRVASPTSEFLDSIAVVPFENVGGKPEMKYLGDGITTFPTEVWSDRKRPFLAVLFIVVVGIILGLGVFLKLRAVRPRAPEFQRLTARQGKVYSARFAPDGHNVIYAAWWDRAPVETFSTDVTFSGTRSLGFPGTAVLAVSSSAQMAVLQRAERRFLLNLHGTLSQVPVTGGSPRQIVEDVEWADWAPNGKALAIVRVILGKKKRLEFPVGHVVYETTGWISHPRVSPKGDQIAFLDHLNNKDDLGVVSVVDLAGRKRILSSGWETEEGLAWSPAGDEVWFSATETGLQRRIYAVDLSGHLRLIFAAPGGVTLEDIAPDGRLLLTRDEQRTGMMALAKGATGERDLSWLDWSVPADLSPDGNTILFDEQGEQRGSTYTVAIRDMRESPPVPLGEGMADGFSPDGKWAAATVGNTQLELLPTGVGTTKRIERGDIEQYGYTVRWLPDRKRIVFSGNQASHLMRCFIQDIDGAKPRPVTPEGVYDPCLVSPDGKLIAANNPADKAGRLYAMDGGESRPIPGLYPGEDFAWTSDPKFMYVYQLNQIPQQIPISIYRLDIATGRRQLFEELKPSVAPVNHILLTQDGRAYVYGYVRLLSDLYLVKGLK